MPFSSLALKIMIDRSIVNEKSNLYLKNLRSFPPLNFSYAILYRINTPNSVCILYIHIFGKMYCFPQGQLMFYIRVYVTLMTLICFPFLAIAAIKSISFDSALNSSPSAVAVAVTEQSSDSERKQ